VFFSIRDKRIKDHIFLTPFLFFIRFISEHVSISTKKQCGRTSCYKLLNRGNRMKKLLSILSLASVTTFGLFAFMAYLVHNDDVNIAKPLPPIIVDVYQTEKETPHEEITRVLPQPPKPPEAIPLVMTAATETEVDDTMVFTQVALDIPTTSTELKGTGLGRNYDARPIVRISPKYPMTASRDGIEGWVKLAFDINKLGEVVNIRIIESDPKRVFDKAAKQALKRWKYKAKSVNGDVVYQAGQSVQLDFNMNQTI
jgi:protein TonB